MNPYERVGIIVVSLVEIFFACLPIYVVLYFIDEFVTKICAGFTNSLTSRVNNALEQHGG